jgi:hypothetical protein
MISLYIALTVFGYISINHLVSRNKHVHLTYNKQVQISLSSYVCVLTVRTTSIRTKKYIWYSTIFNYNA